MTNTQIQINNKQSKTEQLKKRLQRKREAERERAREREEKREGCVFFVAASCQCQKQPSKELKFIRA